MLVEGVAERRAAIHFLRETAQHLEASRRWTIIGLHLPRIGRLREPFFHRARTHRLRALGNSAAAGRLLDGRR